ncbi:unnamed protein product, partial [Tilletia controversa]
KGQAAKSKKKSKAKSKVAATTKEKGKGRTVKRKRSHSIDVDVDVDDIVDDTSGTEEGATGASPKPAKGAGSKGSKYIKFFKPQPITFEYMSARNRPHKRVKVQVQRFKCLFCTKGVRVVNNRVSPLALHFNDAVPSSCCKRTLNPHEKSLRGTFGPYQAPPPFKGDGNMASTWAPSVADASVAGWIANGRRRNVKEQIAVIRRLAIIWLIVDSQPFTTLRSTAFLNVIRAINPEVEDAFRSPRTVGRDIALVSDAIRRHALSELRRHSFGIQVDEWTSPGMQHAFQATVVSFVDDDWTYKSFCIDFQVLRGRHSGATFSGLLVDLLVDEGLLQNWNKTITSDTASANTRMATCLQQRLEEEQLDVDFDPSRDHIRCFAHHLSLVVQALYSALGVPKTKRRSKIISSDEASIPDPGPNLDDPRRRAKLIAPLNSDSENDDISSDDFDEDDEDDASVNGGNPKLPLAGAVGPDEDE